jgi:hypothetical protein
MFVDFPADDPLAWRPETWDIEIDDAARSIPPRRPAAEDPEFRPSNAQVWDVAQAFELDSRPPSLWDDSPLPEVAPTGEDEAPRALPQTSEWWADLERGWEDLL